MALTERSEGMQEGEANAVGWRGAKCMCQPRFPSLDITDLTRLHGANSEYSGQHRSIVEQICIIIRED